MITGVTSFGRWMVSRSSFRHHLTLVLAALKNPWMQNQMKNVVAGFLGMGLVMGLGFRIVLLDDHSTLGTWMMECFVALAAFQWLPTTFFFLPMKEQALYFL